MSRKQKGGLWGLAALGTVIVLAVIISVVRSLGAQSAEPTQPEPTARKNEYDSEAFDFDGDFLRYSDGCLVGIDVSVHQGVIDWQTVADSGVEFAVIRAGYRGSTVGELYEDEQFRENLREARAAGLRVGVYFFSQALNLEEAIEEAQYVCGLLEGESLDLPVYFDWEFIGGRVESISDVDLTACAVAFCEEVKSRGYIPGVYFNQEFGYHYLDLIQLQDYRLWLAEYNETPTFRYHFDCLQYSASGTVPGIETPVDLDLLFPS